MITFLISFYDKIIDYNFWVNLFTTFQAYGPIPPILLAYTEALIPMLPLVAIITFNVASHGIFWGYLFSWVGSTVGAITVFMFFKYIRNKQLLIRILSHKHIEKMMDWVAKQNKGLLFLLTIFPFTPSCLINISFGLADYSNSEFISTIIVSKAIMIASLVIFGSSVVSSMREPIYIYLSVFIIIVLYLASNYLKKYSKIDDINKK